MTWLKFNQILMFIHHLQLLNQSSYNSYLIKVGFSKVRVLQSVALKKCVQIRVVFTLLKLYFNVRALIFYMCEGSS